MPECHPGTNIEIFDSVPTSEFRCAIKNVKRYMKHNSKTVQHVSRAAHIGDYDALEELLSTGDETNLFNGDLNEHVTNRTPLHLAAMTGQTECVELLLEAKADPHMRERVPFGTDPVQGKTAAELARERGWDDTVELLEAGMKDYKYGSYVAVGPGNNAKNYDCYEAGTPPDKVESFIWRPGAAALQGLKPEDYGGALPVVDEDGDFGAVTAAATPALKPLPIAMLFPGQGSQYVKMLSTVRDMPKVAEMCKTAERVLGRNLGQICLEGPEERLDEFENAQPAMFIAGLAGLEKLRKDNADAVERCQAMAGLSLGEYTALCAAGVFSFEDGLRLVELRGRMMQAVAKKGNTQASMSVAGLDRNKLEELCAKALAASAPDSVCQIANVLFPKGFSVAGTEAAILKLKDLCDESGALQAKVLRATCAFHTPLMAVAAETVGQALDEMLPRMSPPRHTVYMNTTATALKPGTNPQVIVDILKRQLTSVVLWEPCVRQMIKDGISEFYELGPMKQIKAMMKRIDAKVWMNTMNVEI